MLKAVNIFYLFVKRRTRRCSKELRRPFGLSISQDRSETIAHIESNRALGGHSSVFLRAESDSGETGPLPRVIEKHAKRGKICE